MRGSLQKKGGKYYAVFRVNKKQKWINLYINAKKGNKREAEAALTRLLAEYNENPNMFDKIDFVGYIKKWLKEVITQVDIVTYEGYKTDTENHLIPYFEQKNLMLQDVKIADIEKYYNYKAVTGRLDGKPGGLSCRTLKIHGTILSLIFKKAIREELIRDNPCQYARLPKMQKTTVKPSFYTVEQCNRLLEVSKSTMLHDMLYMTIIYGLRRSELMGLRWDAVDFENNTIVIQHTVVLQNQVVAKDSTKNKTSNRVYPLLDDVKPLLEKLLEKQKKNKDFFKNCYSDSGYIFAKEDGTPYYPSYPSHELQKVLKKNELPHIRFHDLRHSCASMLILRGWNMKDISEWLGHADISTTMNIYGHISMKHKRELGQGLKGMFSA